MQQTLKGGAIRAGAQDGPFPLNDIKMALACQAVQNGFFQPLRSFFQRMELEWGQSRTAHAHVRKGKPIITLGREFFAKNVLSVNEAAEIVLHEIMHHLFGHLHTEACQYDSKYSQRVVGLAQDALINAYLAQVHCASFMERFYTDKDEFSFLRPNSQNFKTAKQRTCETIFELIAKEFAKEVSTVPSSEPVVWKAPVHGHTHRVGRYERSGSMPMDVVAHEKDRFDPLLDDSDFVVLSDLHIPHHHNHFSHRINVEEKPANKVADFYDKVQALDATLEEALDFFKKHFEEEGRKAGTDSAEQPLLGSHDRAGEKSPQAVPTSSEAATKLPRPAGVNEEVPAPNADKIFNRTEALDILRSFGIEPVSQKARDNFASVIRSIVTLAKRQGEVRSGKRLARRMPAKITNGDLLSIEAGRDLFSRSTFSARDYAIFLDVSGSVTKFIPFVNGLVRSLRAADRPVRCFVWADLVAQVPAKSLGTEEQPSVGSGTIGEAVAAFIAENGIKQAVVITDNFAGTIATRIDAQVTLCLFPNSGKSGSFLDKSVVPRCRVHNLEVDGEDQSDDD